MVIHVRFDVLSMKGRNGNMTIYFFYESGKRLSDFNDRYTTPDGQIAIGTSLTPSYQHSVYNDVALFMPYSELHMAGGLNKEPLKFEIKIWDSDGTEVASTGNRFYSFHYSS